MNRKSLATIKIDITVVCYHSELRQKKCKYYMACELPGLTLCNFNQASICTNKSAIKEAMNKYEGK